MVLQWFQQDGATPHNSNECNGARPLRTEKSTKSKGSPRRKVPIKRILDDVAQQCEGMA